MIPHLTDAEVARFRSKMRTDRDGCWLWESETNNKGYGRFSIYRGNKRIRILAHRLAYKLATSGDPGEKVVRHNCDNPPCCNPSHLRIGTQAENTLDSIQRGRANMNGLAVGHLLMADQSIVCRLRIKKLCPSCATVKSIDEFHRARNQPDGRQGWCKKCRAVNLRETRRDDPEFRARELARTRRFPCPACQRSHRLTKDGTFQNHLYRGARCAGSGERWASADLEAAS